MGKADNHTPVVVGRKSDKLIVPEKQPNKADLSVVEVVEESGLTKRNIQQDVGGRTQSRKNTSSNLLGIGQAAAKDSRLQFSALFHHLTLSLLRESFFQLKRNLAAGVDGVTWQSYQQDLEIRLQSLHERVHKGSYRPRPALRVFIPKADGRERPMSTSLRSSLKSLLNQLTGSASSKSFLSAP